MCNKGVTEGYLSSNKCALPLYGYVVLLKFSAYIDGGPRSARTALRPTTSRSRKNISNTSDQSQVCVNKKKCLFMITIFPLNSPLPLLYCYIDSNTIVKRERISCLDLQFMWNTRNQVALGFLYGTIGYVQWRWRYLYDINICPPFQTYNTDGWFG